MYFGNGLMDYLLLFCFFAFSVSSFDSSVPSVFRIYLTDTCGFVSTFPSRPGYCNPDQITRFYDELAVSTLSRYCIRKNIYRLLNFSDVRVPTVQEFLNKPKLYSCPCELKRKVFLLFKPSLFRRPTNSKRNSFATAAVVGF